ncbi:MAG: hypothetical protein ACFFDI_12815 [Promethearchaeota archaeon]
MTYEVNEEFLAKLVTIPRATGYEFPAQRELICLDDVKNTVDLVVEFIKSIKEEHTFIPV